MKWNFVMIQCWLVLALFRKMNVQSAGNLDEMVNYGRGVKVVHTGLTQNAVAGTHQESHMFRAHREGEVAEKVNLFTR
jgi:hypothetical protein